MSKRVTDIAFLRGINVGGNKIIKMECLRPVIEKMLFSNVRTFLNTGNIIFNTEDLEINILISKIETRLEESFG